MICSELQVVIQNHHHCTFLKCIALQVRTLSNWHFQQTVSSDVRIKKYPTQWKLVHSGWPESLLTTRMSSSWTYRVNWVSTYFALFNCHQTKRCYGCFSIHLSWHCVYIWWLQKNYPTAIRATWFPGGLHYISTVSKLHIVSVSALYFLLCSCQCNLIWSVFPVGLHFNCIHIPHCICICTTYICTFVLFTL